MHVSRALNQVPTGGGGNAAHRAARTRTDHHRARFERSTGNRRHKIAMMVISQLFRFAGAGHQLVQFEIFKIDIDSHFVLENQFAGLADR